MTSREELARAFHRTQSFKWDPDKGFTLASGATSPYYVDCRALMANPSARHLVAQLAWEAVRSFDITCIGGLEIGAISIATTISDYGYTSADRQEWRTFVVRKQPKGHGLGKLIEGAVQPGDRALVVDDVLTSGGSLLKVIAAARDIGIEVSHALVLVDREEQNGRARIEQEKVRLVSLLTIQNLLKAGKHL